MISLICRRLSLGLPREARGQHSPYQLTDSLARAEVITTDTQRKIGVEYGGSTDIQDVRKADEAPPPSEMLGRKNDFRPRGLEPVTSIRIRSRDL